MRHHLSLVGAALLAVCGLAACDSSVLDVSPKDQIAEEAIFEDPNLTQAFLNDIYLGMGHGLYEIMLSSLSDEAHFVHGYNTDKVVQAIISPSDRGAIDDGRFNHFDWGDNYFRIRQANLVLSRIDSTTYDEERKRQMKGEALFLRAYFYHNLLRMYGGVPLVTEVYGLNDDYEIPRSSFEETVDFILADATQAAELLPVEASNLGRATKGAALALKARVLLYAASDLYHENPSGMAETGYTTPQDRQAMWRAAKDAAKEVMDLGVYGLFRPDPATPEEAAQNYADLFLQKISEEVILSRFFLRTRDDGYHPGLHNGPNGFHNWAGNTPTQNLVDDYRMLDGAPFDWGNPEHAASPYDSRDPRFYGTILYDGAEWRERPDDVMEIEPYGIIQTFRRLTLPDGRTFPGVDTRDSPIEDWNGSYSGYYLRKFIDPTVNHQFTKQEIPWIFFRYAEILLNYAEASIELGELDDAVMALNQIRRRAGMPELSASMGQDALREEYRNERRIEMAYEEQRFFDVRRWMIAPEEFSENARGINIYIEGTSRTDRSTWTNYRYEVQSIQNRAWDDKMYFMPIHRDEMNRNPALVQNPGY
ncbi:MAG TPA: RagB/SusD family nutrient uptake outer membrane protein [Longimicrobiaceae bacterium]